MVTVKNLSRSPSGSVTIPTTAIAYSKIQIIDDSNVTYTVLDTYGGADADNYTIEASVNRSVTNKLASFTIILANIDGRYLNKFDGGEYVHFYSDETDATTHIFTGRIDDVKYGISQSQGFTVKITGREYPQFVDTLVSGIHVSATAGEALATMLYDNFSDMTLMFWNGAEWAEATHNPSDHTVSWSKDVPTFPTTLVNISYSNKKPITVIEDICIQTGLDAYTDYDITNSRWTLKIFLQGDITNTGSNIGYGVNLLGFTDYGSENSKIYNRIKIYGKTDNNAILLMKTEEDATSQSNLWIKDKVINAADLETMDEIKDRADKELIVGLNQNNDGRITTVLLHSLRPGETINVSIPYVNINGTYRIMGFTHNFTKNETTVNFNNVQNTITDMIIPKINASEIVSVLKNFYGMKDSITVFFDEDPSIVTVTGCRIELGQVQLLDVYPGTSTVVTSGTVTSNTYTTDYTVTECEFRRYGAYYESDTYEVSANAGASGTWEDITDNIKNGIPHTFANPGTDLVFKININRRTSTSQSPVYESVCLLYK